MADFQKFLSSFDSSNLKGKQFEKFCKWFLENDTYWKSKFTKVYLWDDYPKRWGADLGIDLIAEADDGSLCAIQAKCYSPEYPVTKKDMDSFLSESNRKEISTRLLLASTDIIGGNARKVCQSQEKPVTFFLYSDFLNSTIEFPEDINKLTKPKLKTKPKPRPHQADAIKNVLKGFKKHDRGQLIMACGTGKTFTTLWIKEKLNAETTLILLPSLNLLSQTLKEWYFGASKPFKSFAVCSDDSVTKSTEEDAVKESTQDLSFPVSADPKQIQNFLKQKGTKVLFSTYQSSPMIAEAMKSKSVPLFDLVVCDEAHRCSGEVGGTFTTVLDDKKIRTKLKLFTTATPRTYSQSLKNNAKIKEVEIVGMDDEKIFGPVFHTLSFGQAIASDPPLLTDYQVVVVGIDSLMTKDLINERALLQIKPNDNIDAESLAAHIGLLKAIKDYGLKRLISFHNRVSRAKNFSEDLIDIKPLISKKHLPNGNLKTDYVSGDMPTKKRYQYLQQLKELNGCDYYILSNARCLSEGVDVPSIDGIAIIDPKRSKTDIVQAIGRAIRLSENKTKGTIVIPVFIANGENAEEKINNSNFKAVYDVLNALRAHDEELGFELDEMRMELGRNRTSTRPSKKIPKVFIDIPTKYSIEFSNSIQTYLVEQSTASWNFWYGLLQKYFIEHGNTKCAVDKVYEGYPLGRWISSQRSIKKTGNRGINEERVLLLEKFPDWTWDLSKFIWESNYEFLLHFVKKHGVINFKLLDNEVNPATGNNLSMWCFTQKENYQDKIFYPRSQLNEYTIKLLSKLPGWSWNDRNYDKWEKTFKDVETHIEKFPQQNNFTISNAKLRRWCMKQVDNYNNQKLSPLSQLDEERIERLNKRKWWLWKLEKLRNIDIIFEYYERYGHLIFKKAEKFEGINIAKALKHIKENRLAGKLSTEDEKRFEKVKSWDWDGYQYIWNFMYDFLYEFTLKNDISSLPVSFKLPNKEFKIKDWVNTQKKDYKKKSPFLTPSKIEKLLKIPNFSFDIKHDTWMKNYELLIKYLKENGHASPIAGEKFCREDLGGWVFRQRQKFRNGDLEEKYIKLLNKIGFIWQAKRKHPSKKTAI